MVDVSAKAIAEGIAKAVRDDTFTPGTQLPPIRIVATELGVSPTTVTAAWGLLARSGVIVTGRRRGTTIARSNRDTLRYRRAVDPARSSQFDLSTGVPDPALLPDLTSAVGALAGSVSPGSYLDDPVLPELLDHVRSVWPYDASGLTIVDGAMDALDLFTRAALGFGDRVIVETPCFPPLLDLLESERVGIVPVGLDADGIRIGEVDAALRTSVRAIFIQPRAQNPTGVSMSNQRAQQLGELLTGTQTLIVEDDSWAGVATAPPVSVGRWLPQQTVHVRSFSKSHGPDLRIAAMSGPAQLLDDVSALRQRGQGWTSRILQRILLELLRNDDADRRVGQAREIYADRRSRTVAALADEGIEVTGTDGFNIWVPVADETAAVMTLANQGIAVAPGAPFRADTAGPPHVRVTVSALDDRYGDVARAIADAARRSHRALV